MTDRKSSKNRERLEQLIHSGVKLFARQSYNNIHMAQIAQDMKVAPGTLYLYVESKQALFDFLISYTFKSAIDLQKVNLPIKSTRTGTTSALLKKLYLERNAYAFIEEALERKSVKDIRAEFEGILRKFYRLFVEYRHGIGIIMASAVDFPEFQEFFYKYLRDSVVQLMSDYLSSRIKMGLLRKVPDARATARLILEVTIWFAVHRRGGMNPTIMDEKLSEETVVDTLLNAFLIHNCNEE